VDQVVDHDGRCIITEPQTTTKPESLGAPPDAQARLARRMWAQKAIA
jgi:hypothetical protein